MLGLDEQRFAFLQLRQIGFAGVNLNPQAARVGDDEQGRAGLVGAELLAGVEVAFDDGAGQRAAQGIGSIAFATEAGDTAAGPLRLGLGGNGCCFGLLPILLGDDAGFAQHAVAFQRLRGDLGICTRLAGIGQRLAVVGGTQYGQRLTDLDRIADIDGDALDSSAHLREDAHGLFLVP
ncbi:hypothetical protein SDC9_182111 [bioreactor metagenome]|uniref:Uncharacterized protein n=1 Tax=bioreactor metagenome TaxID=1076179 RepID=A0A645H6F9_9ZZZZ